MLKSGLIASGLVAAMVGAGIANADPDEFAIYGNQGDQSGAALAKEMNAAGANVTAGWAQSFALETCQRRQAGTSSHLLMDMLIDGPSHLTIHLAVASVRGAEWHFCPQLNEPLNPPRTTVPEPTRAPMHTLDPNPPTLEAGY